MRNFTYRFIKLILTLAFLVASAHAQGVAVHDTATQIAALAGLGNVLTPIPNAIVTVCQSSATGTPCSPTASVFTDITLSTAAPNPLNADANGNYVFYVAAGQYKVSVTSVGTTGYLYPLTAGSPSGGGLGGVALTGTPSVGQVPTATGTATATWQTPPGATQPSFQTNGTNNTTQTVLNLQSSTGASGINVANPSGGNVQATLANVTGQGARVITTNETTPSVGDFSCYTGVLPSAIANCTVGVAVNNLGSNTSYTVVSADRGRLIIANSASAVTITIAQAGTGAVVKNFYFAVRNLGAGAVTVQTTTSTFNGSGTSTTIAQNHTKYFYTDNVNYYDSDTN